MLAETDGVDGPDGLDTVNVVDVDDRTRLELLDACDRFDGRDVFDTGMDAKLCASGHRAAEMVATTVEEAPTAMKFVSSELVGFGCSSDETDAAMVFSEMDENEMLMFVEDSFVVQC